MAAGLTPCRPLMTVAAGSRLARVIEGVEAPAGEFTVGVQWHAESLVSRREQANLFRGLVDASMRLEAEDVRELAA